MLRYGLIIKGSKIIMAVLLITLLQGCGNAVREKIEETPTNNLTEKFGTEIYEIIRLASLAPSSHNTQPWKVKILDNSRIEIRIDTARILKVVDYNLREVYLSLGCFIINLRQAALSYGMDCGYYIANEKEFCINILLFPNDVKSNLKIREAIEQRRTLRKNFINTEIPDKDIKELFPNYTGIKFYKLNSPEGKIISNAVLESNVIQAENKEAQNELAEWIRWTNSDAKKLKDGLTPGTMEITGIPAFIVRTFYDKENVKSESFKNKTIDMVKEQIEQGSGWILITNDVESINQLINIGMVYENACLKIRDKKIAFHPMSQPIEEKTVYEKLKNDLGITGEIHFIIRAGYVDEYPEPVSFRRDVVDFTTIK